MSLRNSGLALAVTAALYAGSGISSFAQVYAQEQNEKPKEESWVWGDAKKTNVYPTSNQTNYVVTTPNGLDCTTPTGDYFVATFHGESPSEKELYAHDPNSFLNAMLFRELASKAPDKKFVLLHDKNDVRHMRFQESGIYLVSGGEVADFYPRSIDKETKDDVQISLRQRELQQFAFWTREYAQVRFLGKAGGFPPSLRYLDQRKPDILLETSNGTLKLAQKLVNDAKYDAARGLLKRSFEAVEDIATASMLEGVIIVHENLAAWRNQGKYVDIEKMLGEAKTKFDVAIAADAKFERKTLEMLLGAGVVVYQGKFLPESDSTTVEKGLLAQVIAFEKGDRTYLKRAIELSVSYWKARGESTKDLESFDVDKFDMKSLKESIPKNLVFGWWQYNTSARHNPTAGIINIFSSQTELGWGGEETILRRDDKFFWLLEK